MACVQCHGVCPDDQRTAPMIRVDEAWLSTEARYNELIRMIERSSINPGAKKEKIEQIQAKKDKSAKLVAVGVR